MFLKKLWLNQGSVLRVELDVCKHFDEICQFEPLSSRHTIARSMKDIDPVLQELLKSRVFWLHTWMETQIFSIH